MLAIALVLAAAPYEQWGITGGVGASIPIDFNEGPGVRGSIGAHYGMLPPPDSDFVAGINHPPPGVYVTPGVSFLASGSFSTHLSRPPAEDPGPLSPLAERRPQGDVGTFGGTARFSLDIVRRGGMLLPDFSAWLTTGTELVFDGRGFRGLATHVGFGLGIDFIRDVAPTLAGWVFSKDAFAGVMQFTVEVAFGMMKTGYGILVGLGALVFVPIVAVAGMTAFFLGGSGASLSQVELRYTVLASPRGMEGSTGVVVGVGI